MAETTGANKHSLSYQAAYLERQQRQKHMWVLLVGETWSPVWRETHALLTQFFKSIWQWLWVFLSTVKDDLLKLGVHIPECGLDLKKCRFSSI